MVYEEYPPPARLRHTIAAFWRFELESGDGARVEHVVPPDGTVTVAMAIAGSTARRIVAVGPRLTALRVQVHRGVWYAGLRSRPGRGAVLLGTSPLALRGRAVMLEEVAPERARLMADVGNLKPDTIVERLAPIVDRWIEHQPPPDATVDAMVGAILAARGDLRVSRLTTSTGIGYRQALRRFQREVGLSPKELARLIRIRWACLLALGSTAHSWAALSAESGFSDQAHLSREFTDVFGWRPALVREYLKRIEHVRVTP